MISVVLVCWQQVCWVLLIWKHAFIFEWLFHLCTELLWQFFLLSASEMPFHCFYWFWWEVRHKLNHCSSVCNVLILLLFSVLFSFALDFIRLVISCLCKHACVHECVCVVWVFVPLSIQWASQICGLGFSVKFGETIDHYVLKSSI